MSKATPQPETIDPVTFARFIVMPGLNKLLDAFGRIPPGPMRESVIHLATTLADQYSNAPPEYAMADPLLIAAGHQAEPPIQAEKVAQLPKGPIADSPEADVIRRRKKGQHPQQIALDAHLPRSHVDKMIAEAKKAGITFPNIRGARGRPMEQKAWHTTLDTMRGQGLSRIEDAARRRGISPQAYLDRKLLAVKMAQEGAQYPEIEKATKSDMKSVSLWLSNARAAGLSVPYAERIMDFREEAARAAGKPQDGQDAASATVHPLKRFFGPYDALSASTQSAIRRAAEKRNLTPDGYLDLKEAIVRRRMTGATPVQIAATSGETPIFVKDTLQEATNKGAKFPPCPKGWAARTA